MWKNSSTRWTLKPIRKINNSFVVSTAFGVGELIWLASEDKKKVWAISSI